MQQNWFASSFNDGVGSCADAVPTETSTLAQCEALCMPLQPSLGSSGLQSTWTGVARFQVDGVSGSRCVSVAQLLSTWPEPLFALHRCATASAPCAGIQAVVAQVSFSCPAGYRTLTGVSLNKTCTCIWPQTVGSLVTFDTISASELANYMCVPATPSHTPTQTPTTMTASVTRSQHPTSTQSPSQAASPVSLSASTSTELSLAPGAIAGIGVAAFVVIVFVAILLVRAFRGKSSRVKADTLE